MAEKLLNREDVLRIARGVELEDCWLTSGATLVLYGVREFTHDVDMVCTKDLADRLEAQGVPFHRDGLDGTRIFTYSEDVELLEDWETEEVVELEGLRSASLLSVRRQKEKLGREKDLADIALIDRFLAKEGGGNDPVGDRAASSAGLHPADEEDYYLLKTNEKTMGRYLRDIMLHSREEAQEDFAGVLEDMAKPDRKFYFFRVELKDGSQVGSVGYTVEDRTPVGKLVHAGYFYLPEFWGRGYGTEAMAEVIRFAFQENGVYRISTGCLAENRGSERIMQKCGLIKEAEHVDWEWHDGQMKTRLEYRLLRKEYEAFRERSGKA